MMIGEKNPQEKFYTNCVLQKWLVVEKYLILPTTSVAERLCASNMFSGWGSRTLSSYSPAYNPMGYHVGSV